MLLHKKLTIFSQYTARTTHNESVTETVLSRPDLALSEA
jgi:hypothetical protein